MLSTSAAAAAPIPHESVSTYSEALTYLTSGSPALVVFQADKCTTDSNADQAPPGTYGAFRINAFINVPNKSIAFSKSQLVATPDGSIRIELLVYHLKANGEATVDVHFLAPATYTNVRPVKHYSCRLGDGIQLTPAGR
jgi:hypothetical protein